MKRPALRAGPAEIKWEEPALLAARPRVGPRFLKRLILGIVPRRVASALHVASANVSRSTGSFGFPSWRIAYNVLGLYCLLTLLDCLACTVSIVPINCSSSRPQCGLGYHTSSFLVLLCWARGVRLWSSRRAALGGAQGVRTMHMGMVCLCDAKKARDYEKRSGTYY